MMISFNSVQSNSPDREAGNVEQKGQTETQRRMWLTLSFLATACQVVSSILIPIYTDFYPHSAQFDVQSLALPSINLGLSFASFICVCLSTWTMPSQLREYFRIHAYLIVFLVRLIIFVLACSRHKIVVIDLSCVPFIFELFSTLEIRHAALSQSRWSERFSQAVVQNLGGNIDFGRLLSIIDDVQVIVEKYIEAALTTAAVICILAQISISVLMCFYTHQPVKFMFISFELAFINFLIVWILEKLKSFNSSVTSREESRLMAFGVMVLIRAGMSMYASLSVFFGIPVYNLDFTCIPFMVELYYIYMELRSSEDPERVASAQLGSREGSEIVASV